MGKRGEIVEEKGVLLGEEVGVGQRPPRAKVFYNRVERVCEGAVRFVLLKLRKQVIEDCGLMILSG